MTPDVNILVAASRRDHVHHAPALAWLEGALETSTDGQMLAILPMVACGFLRLTTHPKVFVEPTPLKAAQAFLRAVLDTPNVTMPMLGEEWSLFEKLCAQTWGATLSPMPGSLPPRCPITCIWSPSTRTSAA